MVKKEKIIYKCLSQKDKEDLKKWLKKPKKKEKPKKRSLSQMGEALRGKPYSVFLDSEYWKIVRGLVIKRDRGACIICRSTKNLQVHHDHYNNHFKEHKNLKDLMTLCRNCHKEHHYCTD